MLETNAANTANTAHTANILLIDDRADNLLALEAILTDLGYPLVKAQSGEEALRQLLRQEFAVILLDVQMPGMDGFETAKLIRQREKTQHIPIIFITAINRTEQHLRTGYLVGAVDYLFKPLVPEILRAKVTFFVESFQKSQEIQQQAGQIEHMNGELQERLGQVSWLNEQLGSANKKLQQSTQKLRSALERSQTAERAKDRLLSNVTHEMRTPLSSIIGFSNLILHRNLGPEKIQEYVSIINHETRRLADLINNFLDLQRLEAGQQTFHFGPVDLAALVQDVVTSLHLDNNTHEIQLQLDSILSVHADADRIRQVVVNLLSNAIKYSPGGGEIVVSLWQDGNDVHFSVRDPGLGIAPDEMGNLFKRFHRGKAAEHMRVRGTGLGLALCKELIDGHRGRLWAESAGYNQGTVFSFTLPVVQDAEQLPVTVRRLRTRQIVIVANDLNATWSLAAYLEIEGYATQSLAYDDAAPDQIAKYAPDIVILNSSAETPELVWRLVEALQNHESTQNLPIVVCAHTPPPREIPNPALVLYLEKPLDETSIANEVTRLSRRIRAARRAKFGTITDARNGNSKSVGPGKSARSGND